MATIAKGAISPGGIYAYQGPSFAMPWANMANGDVGDNLFAGNFRPESVQVTGTFGVGGSVSLEGTNDGVNWSALLDQAGNAITFTQAGLKFPAAGCLGVRPHVTAGDGTTSLTVTVFMRRQALSQ